MGSQEVTQMGMDMRTRKTVVKEAAKRYRRARKKDKGRLLDEFVALTGYNRCYAARVLRGGAGFQGVVSE
jgi:hypothetical protein